MAYMNEEVAVPTFQIVGSFDMRYLSYGSNKADYKGYTAELFHTDVFDGEKENTLPHIIPGKTAFFIRYVNDGYRVVREILALVDSVTEYTLDAGTGICTLKFSFTEVPINTYDPNLMEIKPVISHILTYDGFIAVIFEGDSEYTSKYVVANMKTFSHGGVMYWQSEVFSYGIHLQPGEPSIDTDLVGVAVVLIASTLKVPDVSKYGKFEQMVQRFMSHVYNTHTISGGNEV